MCFHRYSSLWVIRGHGKYIVNVRKIVELKFKMSVFSAIIDPVTTVC